MFRGLIDNIQVYDVVLTAQQIATIQRVNPASISNARLAMSPACQKNLKPKVTLCLRKVKGLRSKTIQILLRTSTQIDMYVPSSVSAAQVVVRDVNGRAFNKILKCLVVEGPVSQ